jgi:proteasome-associated ATPase
VPAEAVARIVVGGAEYYANIDPRLPVEDLKIGTQILVNEAYTVIKALGYDRNGPVLKVAEVLPDGRIRFEQDMGRQALILQRSSSLLGADLKTGGRSPHRVRHTGSPSKNSRIVRPGRIFSMKSPV